MSARTTKRSRRQQALKRVGDNLYRSDDSGIYYAIFKRNGKQIRRSLHTIDKELARRRMEDLRRQIGRISTSEGRHLPFAEYDHQRKLIGGAAKSWIDVIGAGVEPSTRDRYLGNIRTLAGFVKGLTIRALTLKHIETWVASRTPDVCAASTFNQDLGTNGVIWSSASNLIGVAGRHGCRCNSK